MHNPNKQLNNKYKESENLTLVIAIRVSMKELQLLLLEAFMGPKNKYHRP